MTVKTDETWLTITIRPGREAATSMSGVDEVKAVYKETVRENQTKRKESFYQATADSKRMRAAFLATQFVERRSSLSAFISEAVMKEVERLEGLHNDGCPWPDTGVGKIPKGAPLRD